MARRRMGRSRPPPASARCTSPLPILCARSPTTSARLASRCSMVPREAFTSGTSTSPAGRRAVLGVGERVLLVLVERPGARSVTHSTGLYHFALLVAQRVDLARWLAHAAHERVALIGLSDHFVSEAVYLNDPDGHGIEIYWDRPCDQWEGQVAARMTTLPLDVESLLAELPDRRATDFRGLSAGTVMGHVHLKVAAVPQAIAFYRDVLGFALMAALGDTPRFSAPAATTTTLVPTPGKAQAPPRHHPVPWLCATRRSCCPTRPSANACSHGWRLTVMRCIPARRDRS